MVRVLAVLSVVFLSLIDVWSLSVVPFIHDFNPDNIDEWATQYYVENKTDGFLAFMLSTYRRLQNKDGSDNLKLDDKSFIVQPSQIIIPPHSRRIVKVVWVGNPEFKRNPNKEQAFRVCMDQFPIKVKLENVKTGEKETLVLKMPKEKKENLGGAITVTYAIWTSLYATPKDAVANLVVVHSDSNTITIENKGTRRGEVSSIGDVVCDGKPVKDWLKKEDLDSVILAGTTCTYKKSHKVVKAVNNKSDQVGSKIPAEIPAGADKITPAKKSNRVRSRAS
ncbi:MAG: hypothetical protein IJA14_02595 [Alphaproteobacteria bacterium]|nr:hypothetical protein [Alphaproteobacteria bacterium]